MRWGVRVDEGGSLSRPSVTDEHRSVLLGQKIDFYLSWIRGEEIQEKRENLGWCVPSSIANVLRDKFKNMFSCCRKSLCKALHDSCRSVCACLAVAAWGFHVSVESLIYFSIFQSTPTILVAIIFFCLFSVINPWDSKVFPDQRGKPLQMNCQNCLLLLQLHDNVFTFLQLCVFHLFLSQSRRIFCSPPHKSLLWILLQLLTYRIWLLWADIYKESQTATSGLKFCTKESVWQICGALTGTDF